MKIIKLIILAGKDIWKHRWAYVVLSIELILVEILLLSFASKLQGAYESRKVCNAFNNQNMYYYTQYRYTNQSLKEILSKDVLDKVEITEMPLMAIADSKGKEYVACGYTDSLMEACQYDMTKGKWLSDYKGKNIPAISTDKDIPIGTYITVKNGGDMDKIEVIGYMNKNAYVINFHGGSGNGMGSLEEFVSHPDFQLILPYQSKQKKSITEKQTVYTEMCKQKMVFVKNPSVTSKLLKECHDYGAMTDVSVMKDNYDTDIKNDFIMNGTILVVFTILSITGLIGFNGIQSAKQERSYLIYHLLGGRNRDFILIEILKNSLVVIMSFGVFALSYKKMGLFTYSANQLNRISWQTIAIVFLMITFICTITSLWYIRRLAHTNWINAYKLKS